MCKGVIISDLHPRIRSKHDVILDINDRCLGTFEEYVTAVSKGFFRPSGRRMWTSVTMLPLTNEFYIQSPRLQRNARIPDGISISGCMLFGK